MFIQGKMKAKQAVKFAKKCAIFTACSLALAGCEKEVVVTPPPLTVENEQNTLTRAIYTERFQLDPHFVKVAADGAMLRDLIEGLVNFDPKGDIEPAIAQNWFSENQKDWLFVLDEKAKWSNGEPVTAMDFVKSWQRLADPKNGSPSANLLATFDIVNAQAVISGSKFPEELGVEALNPHTLKIRLNSPNPQFPKMLGNIALLPTYQGKTPDVTDSAKDFVSNADYYLSSISPRQLVLKANDIDLPFQRVEYHILETYQNNSSFDVIETPLDSQIANIWAFPRLCTYFYEINVASPQLAKKEIRQALKSMILASRLGNEHGIRLSSVLPKSMRKDEVESWSSVPVEQLLERAGVTLQSPLKLNLSYDNRGRHSIIASQIIRTLGQSDLIRVVPLPMARERYGAVRDLPTFQLAHNRLCADSADPAEFLWKYHSAHSDNKSGYKNSEVDKMLERLKAEKLPADERNELIQKIAKQLDDDVVILPIYQQQRKMGFKPSVLGIDLSNNSEVIYSKHLYRIKKD